MLENQLRLSECVLTKLEICLRMIFFVFFTRIQLRIMYKKELPTTVHFIGLLRTFHILISGKQKLPEPLHTNFVYKLFQIR